jgi:lauroyl/myristoyl acyltransferase
VSGAPRGTIVQRVRATLLAAASRLLVILPEGPVDAIGERLGILVLRRSPAAARARRNLDRVVRYLVATGRADARVVAAAADPAAFDALLDDVFAQAARYYLDMMRLPARTAADLDRRLVVETPEAVGLAFGPEAPGIFSGLHFGAVEFPAIFAVVKSGRHIVAPMETLGDPAMQAWIRRTRASVGVDIVGLRGARKALLGALAEGRHVGMVADRNVAGGTIDVEFFGAPAPIPMGPALLGLESGRPVWIAAVRRTGGGRYAGRLTALPIPEGGSRRERIEAGTRAAARIMEAEIAVAPTQWWSLLEPIWPDLDPVARRGSGTLEHEAAPA